MSESAAGGDADAAVSGDASPDASTAVEAAVAAFAAGEPVLLFDSAFREQETDLLWPAAAATPAVMRQLRHDCGGLLFLAIGEEIGELFDLPFLQDLHTNPDLVAANPVLGTLVTDDLRYDSRSAFTLSVNHRRTYTGITDHDRALTTRRFAELTQELLDRGASQEQAIAALGAEYRTPGHIPVCRESPGGFATRQGHTELAVAIARLAGGVACTIGAEMLDPDGDGALPVDMAQEYGKRHGIPFLTGADLLAASDHS